MFLFSCRSLSRFCDRDHTYYKKMDGYAAIPEARKSKEKKRLGCRSWPAILSTVIGCVLCVIVGCAIFVGLIAVFVILTVQSALQFYSPGETRLANTPALFFCKSVSLDVSTNTDDPNTDFEVTIYLVGFTPPTSPIRRPLQWNTRRERKNEMFLFKS